MVLNIDRFVIKSEKFLYGEAENNKHIAFTVVLFWSSINIYYAC